MYSFLPSFVLGFHGCDQSVIDKVMNGTDPLRKSENNYDWLGHGMYFWENSEARALEYAKELQKHPERCNETITTPAVLGAVIDLGNCLNLLDAEHIGLIKVANISLMESHKQTGKPLPENKPDHSGELLLRFRDCAVIETVHANLGEKVFDTTRGMFSEGERVYESAGFHEKSHIQICVRNPNAIKGFFVPREEDSDWGVP